MTDIDRARKLYQQAQEYYLMDTRWQDNYRARLHRLAGKYDANSLETDARIVVLLDVAGHKINIRPKWRDEK